MKISNSFMNNKKNQQFSTSDFYLAAFLRAKGFQLLDINKTNPQRALFIFKDKEGRQSLVEDFLFGRAEIEPRSFVSAIKELKQLLHSDL
jgi:predicted RNA-binding protein YlxR (DUF448 family)